MKTVTQILQERYGIEAIPGKKVLCPYCKHKKPSFSVSRNDRIGKCFRPPCGRYIPATSKRESSHGQFHKFLEELFYDFHAELLNQKRKSGKNAYTYLTDVRGIHPKVLQDSMLGAVPEKYPIDYRIDQLRKKIREEWEDQKRRDNNENHSKESLEEEMEFIEQQREKLRNLVDLNPRYLCFFYSDAEHQITAIRFRRPYTDDPKKTMYIFKPFERFGLFGHGLFSEEEGSQTDNDLLLVTEGEFNQLQLQSLCVRDALKRGETPYYKFACAVGGVQNTDYETLKAVCETPIICYDNDKSNAGFELVEKAREGMYVSAFTTPKIDSDLDECIRSFGTNYKGALASIDELIKQRKSYPRYYKSIKADVNFIRNKQGAYKNHKVFQINQEVSQMVIKDLKERGTFYKDTTDCYFFERAEKKLIKVNNDNIELRFLINNYGLNPSEPTYKYLIEELKVRSSQVAERTTVHRFSYFDDDNFILYVSNLNNQLYRITEERIELRDNGTDGVLFINEKYSQPYKIDEEAAQTATSWIDEAVIRTINFDEDKLNVWERKILFLFWMYSLFFGNIMPNKPILAMVGEKESGKSHTLRKVGKLLYGEGFNTVPLTRDIRDFDAKVSHCSYAAFDNVDGKVEWLNDRLAIVSTGTHISRRDYYTTNDEVEYPVDCFLAITSRTPHFKRDDVASRLLIMRVKKLSFFKAEEKFLKWVRENRSQILGELFSHLQEILRALKAERNREISGNFRMGEFYEFCMKVSYHFGIEEKVKGIFGKIGQEQSTFALDDEPIYELLDIWLEKNSGREISTTELCSELSQLAEENGILFPYKNRVKSFSQKFKNIKSDLEDFFNMPERFGGARKKYVTITRREEK